MIRRHLRGRPWRVVRQHHNHAEHEVCQHRWEWTAEWCAVRREASRQHWSEVGVHYTARPAERAA